MASPRNYQTTAVIIKKTKLGEADRILTLYTPDLGKIQAELLNAQEKIFSWSIWAAILLTVLIVLIGITQVAAVMQGWDMMHYEEKLDKIIEEKILKLGLIFED